ncbi:unnamed protein product [Phytomonas sp. Hart1]|nr:unnamed protein product [Phytomonas sp. Hart1]|eukprot:CCW66169.1 unnamed protein product [Phytomonas sp. isolate Hart1]
MLRRAIAANSILGHPCASIGTTLGVANKIQPFSSNYNDSNRQKTQSYYSSRTAAHHQSAVKSSSVAMPQTTAYKEAKPIKETAPITHRKIYDLNVGEVGLEKDYNTDNHEEVPLQRNVKNQTKDFLKSKPQRLSFKSSFSQSNINTMTRAPVKEYEEVSEAVQTYRPDFDDEETDVTKIYSNDEVQHLVQGSDIKKDSVHTSTKSDYVDDFKALVTIDQRADTAPKKRAVDASDDILVVKNQASEERVSSRARDAEYLDDDNEADSFASVSQQPFFSELIRCVEKNMMRYRKEIRQTNRYSLDLINDCVRPLLQLTDFPFTAYKLTDLTSSINPIILKRSLADYAACKRLHVYRSEDTELLLDWSVEDFLRRRYESIHLSWERMNVVYRRFGWNPDIISDRDCLTYFSEFSEFVELAKLEMTVDGKPKAVLITDPIALAERRPIPASNLLIRRRSNPGVEPSITESVRLMGNPAMFDKRSLAHNVYRRHPRNSESVSSMFQAVEKALNDVEGDEATKFAHAIDSVPSLRQAAQPIGRVVREFSIGKVTNDEKQYPSMLSRQEAPVDNVKNGASDQHTRGLDTLPKVYDPELHEFLSNAYHKNKVEITMLRRRLLSISNADEAAEIQTKIMNSRNELNSLIDRLRHMRQLKQAVKQERENNKMSENVINKDDNPEFSVLSNEQDFPEAPEHNLSKNPTAAEDIEDDDIDISKELKQFESEVVESMMNATAAISTNEGIESDEISGKHHKNWSLKDDSAIEEKEAVPESDDIQNSTLDAVNDTAEDEEEVYDRWCREQEMPTNSEDTLHKASHRPSPSSSSFTHDQTEVNPDKVSASLHSEKLLQLCEEVSSAAQNARKEMDQILRQKILQEAAIAKQVHMATNKVTMLEEKLDALRSRHQKACETEAREAAEAKAKAAEEELRHQRELRQVQLERQREQARLAQLEAQKALAQQREAEEAVLAAERKLREVRVQYNLTKQGTDTSEHTKEANVFVNSSITVEKKNQASNVAVTPATSESSAVKSYSCFEETGTKAPNSAPGAFFMCTPEQYNGMQLAASRLRTEIACLEKQMEQEGEEDDETLMTVLAASRADLEELDACISSVQLHAPWAAEQDAKREQENRAKDLEGNAESQGIQNQIAQKRFEISLLERRLHHASERSVINKLEQGIIEVRRQISRLRVEQDRLRRAGTNELGLLPSISITKVLEDEVENSDEEIEDASMTSEFECSKALDNNALDDDVDTAGELNDNVDATDEEDLTAQSFDNEDEPDVDPVAAFDLEGTEDVRGDQPTANAPEEERQKSATASGSPLVDANPETQRLHLRLESMLRDIQHLQDNISLQESSTSYDEDEAEAVLLEMRKKLRELLRLRDDVQTRLVEAMPSGKDKQGSPTNSAAGDAPHTPPEPPLMGSRLSSSIVPSSFRTLSIPIPHLHAEKIRVASALKKMQRSTLKGKGKR